jgi:hypothetical protein
MFIVGLSLMLVSNTKLLNFFSRGMFWFGGQLLFVGFAGDPIEWSSVNRSTFAMICFNGLIIIYLIDNYKKQRWK